MKLLKMVIFEMDIGENTFEIEINMDLQLTER
jgi:hypothetical protein